MPAVDFCLVQLEESPVYEGAVTSATPYRISTDKLYMPVQNAQLMPAPGYLDRGDELRSVLGRVPNLVNMYSPAGSLAEHAYVHDLTWLLSLAGFTGVHTAGDGIIVDPDAQTIPATAHRWVFTKKTGINAQTAQVITNYADESVQLKGNGFALSTLSMNAAGDLTADMLGLVFKRLAVDSSSVPVYATSAIPPVQRGDLFVSWLASGGVIADFSFQIANTLAPQHTLGLNPASLYPDAMEFGDEQVLVTGSVPKRILAAADIDALLSAATFSATARWKTSKVIAATSYTYSMWIEMPAAQLTGGSPDAIGNRRRFGGTYDFQAAYSEGSGYDVKITLVNDVATIATYV